ncbi:response regulator [Mucilaginibacter sp. UR6-11]|uniref:response regulator n=1 Tax=Mucilaginibacter sp. UR6-11 TaxID=1435644 RepID=UPI001E4D9BD0|nr:response regulator [Mucilaginibacter sp. UR6-11]MCC8425564.1 response regulator [Mucilaginibacter sp. UR6-11]
MKRIMIFDDDDDILSICACILEEDDWQVQTYPDCCDLIARVSAFAPDVILMDNCIPDEGGIVATKMLKATDALKNIPVIYFSANSDIQSLAATAGADGYLPKPFDLEVLKTTATGALPANG